MRRNEKGTAYLFVLLVVGLLALITEGVFLRSQAGAMTSGLVLNKQKISYLAEGVAQVASQFAQEYLSNDPAPTTAALNAYVAAKIAPLNIQPFQIESLDVSISGATSVGPIPSGPFIGLDSYQVPVQIDVRVTDQTSSIHSAASKTAVLAKVDLFSFSLFSDLPAPSYLVPDKAMDVRGRTHVNGDFCVGNSGATAFPLRLERITSSGAVRNAREVPCWVAGIAAANDTTIATDQIFTAFASLDPGAGNGCVNCNASMLDWMPYALSTWRGNLLDNAHSVQKLKLPLGGTGQMQAGVLADLTLAPNTGSMRVIVDPVLAADPAGVAQQKLAYKADIRIINGTWFLKDPANAANWPGIPIWSDHPGRFMSGNEEGIEGAVAVGQEDIRARWTATPTQWGAGATPSRFSYYEYDPVNQVLFNDNRGVVSYGSLYRNAAGPSWRPGQWARVNAPELCSATFQCTNCNDVTPLDALALGSMTCSGGVQPNIADFLLNATRSGFNDGHVATASAGLAATQLARSKILPMNLDVSALRDALTDVAPGELGSYFGAGRFMNRPFNGIVYVTNTWFGEMAGLPGGFATDYPFQGAQADPSEPGATHAAGQQALPFQLCSALAADLAGGVATSPYDGTADTHFTVPDCKRYAPAYAGPNPIFARTNVLRIANAANVDPLVFSTGLTIASNLPVYIQGDFNTNSDTTSVAAAPWVPTLVAADQVTLLSKAWDDANSRWDTAIAAILRPAVDTTYNVSILAGGAATTPTNWSAGLEALPRYIEQWYDPGTMISRTVRIRGSLVMGFLSVFFKHPLGPTTPYNPSGMTTFTAGIRDFALDPHLDRWVNQPPGAPAFNIYAIRRWVLQ